MQRIIISGNGNTVSVQPDSDSPRIELLDHVTLSTAIISAIKSDFVDDVSDMANTQPPFLDICRILDEYQWRRNVVELIKGWERNPSISLLKYIMCSDNVRVKDVVNVLRSVCYDSSQSAETIEFFKLAAGALSDDMEEWYNENKG